MEFWELYLRKCNKKMNDFSKLEKELNVFFKNKDLLTQAFCHRSYLNEHKEFKLGHNERLEFLGDAVLELAVTEYLYRTYSDKNEGELTTWRAALVNTKMLYETSQELNFDKFILLSYGETKEQGRTRQSILANCFEAFIGALYLDQGYKKCQDFIGKHLLFKLSEIIKLELYRDSKSKFQEEAQSRVGITPNYKVIKEWGPDHKKNFLVGIFLDEDLVAEGRGNSKQEAENMAAENALKLKEWK